MQCEPIIRRKSGWLFCLVTENSFESPRKSVYGLITTVTCPDSRLAYNLSQGSCYVSVHKGKKESPISFSARGNCLHASANRLPGRPRKRRGNCHRNCEMVWRNPAGIDCSRKQGPGGMWFGR